jgi:hypothetical protein
MRHLQHLFTAWYNRTRPLRRRGSLWADRFKHTILYWTSGLVIGSETFLRDVMARHQSNSNRRHRVAKMTDDATAPRCAWRRLVEIGRLAGLAGPSGKHSSFRAKRRNGLLNSSKISAFTHHRLSMVPVPARRLECKSTRISAIPIESGPNLTTLTC